MRSVSCVTSEHPEIITVVRRTLSAIDPRLMEHGDRVAFLCAAAMRRLSGEFPSPERLLTLALFHDIGAYKTEEIDDMVRFETEHGRDHAAYGYLFLRMAGGLGEDARPVLHHHTPWTELDAVAEPYRREAAMLFLADRADILFSARMPDAAMRLRSCAGTLFRPDYVDALLAVIREEGLDEQLRGAYRARLEPLLRALCPTAAQTAAYLRMLVYAIDFRSTHTVTHTVNTVAISRELGLLMGLDEAEMAALEYGAFLHDIGKIAIPVDILENPGRLTPAEMDVMRTHVLRTRSIIDGFVPDEVRDIASRHHEKLNGSGYPDGLTAEALTVPQRIVAVADVLSALISRRSYKEAFPAALAQRILREMRDRGELCPDVCGALLTHYDAVMARAAAVRSPVTRLYEDMTREYRALCAV